MKLNTTPATTSQAPHSRYCARRASVRAALPHHDGPIAANTSAAGSAANLGARLAGEQPQRTGRRAEREAGRPPGGPGNALGDDRSAGTTRYSRRSAR